MARIIPIRSGRGPVASCVCMALLSTGCEDRITTARPLDNQLTLESAQGGDHSFKDLYECQFRQILAHSHWLLDFTRDEGAHYEWARKTVIASLFHYWLRAHSSVRIIGESQRCDYATMKIVSGHQITNDELRDPFLYEEHGFTPDTPFTGVSQDLFGDMEGYRGMVAEFQRWISGLRDSGRESEEE